MPNGEEQQKKRIPRKYNLYVRISNFLKIRPIRKIFGLRRRTIITKEGKLREPKVVKDELRQLFQLNDRLIGELRTIEDRWNVTDAIIWGGKEIPEGVEPLVGKGNIKGIYPQLGPYTDKSVVELELSYFQHGAGVTIGTGTINVDEVIQEMRESLPDNLKQSFDEDIRNLTQRDWQEIRQFSNYPKVINNGALVTNNELRTPIAERELEMLSRFILDEETRERQERIEAGLEVEEINREESLNLIRKAEYLRRNGTELLHSFGWVNIDGIKEQFTGFGGRWAESAPTVPEIHVDVRNTRERLFTQLTSLLNQVQQNERDHFEFIKGLIQPLDRFGATRNQLLTNAPERVRFKHTYMVIKPFITIEVQSETEEGAAEKKAIFFDDRRNIGIPNNLKPKYYKNGREVRLEEWQLPSEREANVPYGYDENGYPLEINNEGEVLLDIWWNEIDQNKWQLETIAKKPGGVEVLKKELGYRDIQFTEKGGVRPIGNPSRPIRKVDERWVNENYVNPYIDVLDMAVYISNEWDSFRDDFRDGRYHKHSKTAVDYTIAAEGGFDVAPYFKKKFWHLQIPNIRKMYRRAKKYDEFNRHDYINSTSKYFEKGLPNEEELVTRKYKMRLSDGTLEEDERIPSHASPAFDLRALNRLNSRVLWGRMLYYQWPDGINKWSENPFPTISSRGIAQFLMDRILRDLYDYEDQKRTMTEFTKEGYDYGVRRPLVGGSEAKFPRDLIGGTDVVQGGRWF